jgi:phosphoribosylcarboxyaminoimidazole (NCAIR) mutase
MAIVERELLGVTDPAGTDQARLMCSYDNVTNNIQQVWIENEMRRSVAWAASRANGVGRLSGTVAPQTNTPRVNVPQQAANRLRFVLSGGGIPAGIEFELTPIVG